MAPVSTLKLLQVDYVFTQDRPLFPEDFIKEANHRGYEVALETLQTLYDARLLVPLFRIGPPVATNPMLTEAPPLSGSTARDVVFESAAQGRLHDPWFDEAETDPIREFSWEGSERDEWTMYVYSPWQLFDLEDLQPVLDGIGTTTKAGDNFVTWYRSLTGVPEQVVRCRSRTILLCALATRYLWRVTEQLGMPPGVDRAALFASLDSDPELLVTRAEYDPAQLHVDAQNLLGRARHIDPCRDWLPLIRHMDFKTWMDLRNQPLAAIWLRIAAEVLLRCHEDLAESDSLQPLPDMSLLRLSRAEPAPTLNLALTSFGLSPYPAVLLLAEGKTEMVHYPHLLEFVGIGRPEQVHIICTEGSKNNPQLLARYLITPKVRNEIASGWLLSRPATVCYVIMDPEHSWSPDQLDNSINVLRAKIKQGVEEQGNARIDDGSLVHMVRARTWFSLGGKHYTYELANFANDELIPALRALARISPKYGNPQTPEWEASIREYLAKSRAGARPGQPASVGNLLDRLSITKPDLAKELLSKLEEKYQREVTEGKIVTPIVKVIEEVREIVLRSSRKHTMLPRQQENDDDRE